MRETLLEIEWSIWSSMLVLQAGFTLGMKKGILIGTSLIQA